MTVPAYGRLVLRIGTRDTEQGYPLDATVEWEDQAQGSPRVYLDPGILPFGEAESPRADGERLYRWLFADDAIKAAWQRASTVVERFLVVLELDPSAAELAALPFEQLHVVADDRSTLISAELDSPVVRLLPSFRRPIGPVQDTPFRLLVVIASPTDLHEYGLDAIDVQRQRAHIDELQLEVGRRSLEVQYVDEPTLPGIEAQLEGQHALHVVCHGVFSSRRAKGALLLSDGEGRVAQIDNDAFVESVSQRGANLRLVHLSSCHSGGDGGRACLSSLAPALVAAGVPTVLGHRGFLPMATAGAFGAGFYRELMESGLVARAAAAGRGAIRMERLAGAELPTLYASDAKTQIIQEPPGLKVGWREKVWGLIGATIGRFVGGRRVLSRSEVRRAALSIVGTLFVLVVFALAIGRIGEPATLDGADTGCVSGSVVLPAGIDGAVEGWVVEATGDSGVVLRTTTDAQGRYVFCAPTTFRFRALPPETFPLEESGYTTSFGGTSTIDLRQESRRDLDIRVVAREHEAPPLPTDEGSVSEDATAPSAQPNPSASSTSPRSPGSRPRTSPSPSVPQPSSRVQASSPPASRQTGSNPSSVSSSASVATYCVAGTLAVLAGPPGLETGWTVQTVGSAVATTSVGSAGDFELCGLPAGNYDLVATTTFALPPDWQLQISSPATFAVPPARGGLDIEVRADLTPGVGSGGAAKSAPSGAAPAPGSPAGSGEIDWELGSFAPGEVREVFVEVFNNNCRGRHDLSVRSDALWLSVETPLLKGLRRGESMAARARVETSGLAPGEHRGVLTVHCETCRRGCSEDRRLLRFRATVLP